jgi:hypothetical protein
VVINLSIFRSVDRSGDLLRALRVSFRALRVSVRALRVLPVFASLAVVAASPAWAQAPTPGPSTLRVTVRDATALALPHAVVEISDAQGASQQAAVDEQGIATFTGLQPGAYQMKVTAEGFREQVLPIDIRRGSNTASATLVVAISEEILVEDLDTADRSDNGFTQTLTADEIDALSDDPDEMAEQLAQLAGPGAQIFVDGFRGGRLPPKDQIQQIRFNSNSFSAEYHEAGMVRVEVITRPGFGNWRGRANVGFRDESLNARNAFSPVKEPTEQQRYNFSLQGPLARGKTGLSLSVDGNNAFDSRTIRAQSPGDETVTGLAKNTTDGLNAEIRLDHAIGQGGQIRAEYEHRTTDRGNLGVGDFDLPARAYDTEQVSDQFQFRNTRVIGKKIFSELRFEYSASESTTIPLSALPTVRVNEAFTSGGAGQTGSRRSREFELAQNFDFTIGRKHSMRAGVLVEGGWYTSTQQQNFNGTYVFRSLEAYDLGRPDTYTIRVGDPLVEYSQVRAGWFLQDNVRVGRNLNVSVGLRQEIQTQVNDVWNLAPRAAFTWTANRRTTVRGGYGVFYDWYDSNLYEQTLRVNGERQYDLIVENPSFPVIAGGGTRLPSSVIRAASLDQPLIQQASIGLERTLTPWAGLRMDYMWTRGSGTLRSINVNAPVDGVRPDPEAGNISEIQSTGRRASDRLTVGINARHERLRLFTNVMYQLQSSRNFADSATSLPADSTNPDADWGPSAQDIRHRLFLMFNAPIWKGIRAGFNMQVASKTPYNVTTGRDDNGDTVFNDRAPGTDRNSARGANQVNATLRLNKAFGFGGPAGGPGGPGGPGGGVPTPPPPGGGGGGAMNQRGPRGPGGGDGPQMVIMEGASSRYRLDLYAQITNLFNYVNYNTFIGNQLSPFFGTATSAAPARRMELGFSLGF